MSRQRDEVDEERTFAGRDSSARIDDGHLKLLVVVGGSVQEFSLPPGGTPLAVGRSARAHVYIDSPSVSRLHARVVPGTGSAYVEDLGSTNGTFVNGNRVATAPVPVRAGDVVRFGDIPAQVLSVGGRSRAARRLSVVEFDARILEEAERCIRSERSLVALAIEIAGAGGANRAWGPTAACLRSIDVMCERSASRIDVLVVDADRREAEALATRVLETLAGGFLAARIGLASYPGDVPSADALMVGAELAMRTVDGAGVAAARAGARTLVIGTREIVVAEPVMTRLYGMVERLASAKVSVLVTGETGSGKEIVAEALHALGTRAPHRLVKLNCAALPEQLLESELFGHERGAFSGASEAKPGLIEEADGGTLFLDEIGEMAPGLQAKLLRVLEDGRVRRLGSTRDRAVDVRIVAATHRDLHQMAEQGRFRSDLYYRLKGVVLHVPPLRERRREIALLAERFAAEASEQVPGPPRALAPAAVAALTAYAWPGNIRELKHSIAAAVIACEGDTIDVEHLPREIAALAVPDATPPPRRALTAPHAVVAAPVREQTARVEIPLAAEMEAFQRDRITEALLACDGNQTRAAAMLQMPRRTLVHKIAQLGIDVPARPGRPRRT